MVQIANPRALHEGARLGHLLLGSASAVAIVVSLVVVLLLCFVVLQLFPLCPQLFRTISTKWTFVKNERCFNPSSGIFHFFNELKGEK